MVGGHIPRQPDPSHRRTPYRIGMNTSPPPIVTRAGPTRHWPARFLYQWFLRERTLATSALLLLQSRKPAAREQANSPSKIDALSPTMCLAIPAGLVASFVLTVYIAGQLSSMDSHWIGGTRSDAAGIPFLGWSRDGGDLRVAHFFALHGMQFIPFFALLRWPSQSPARDNSTGMSTHMTTGIRVMIITLGYGLSVMALYRQAMNGNAFL